MNFEIPRIHGKSANVRVDYRVLRELLRLPPDVEITYAFPTEGAVVLTLTGNVPKDGGEVVAEYVYEHTTIVKFKGFREP